MFDHRRIITGILAIRTFCWSRSSKLTAAAILLGLFTAAPVPALKVYRTKSEGLADVKVYETNSEGLADCLIYVTSSEGLASGDAKWYFETSEGLADVKVYFTESEGLANKKIYFTKSEGLARCKVDWKGYKKTMALRLCENEPQPFASSLIREMVMPLCSHDEFQLGESR
jgi:Family of unknown function (DUF6150)